MELTKSEMEIMDVFWESSVPLSRSDLLASSEEKTWKDSSVHILLNGLLQKGVIHEAGLVRRSKTYGRVFAPSMTREEYFAESVYSPSAQACSCGSLLRPAQPGGGHGTGSGSYGSPDPGEAFRTSIIDHEKRAALCRSSFVFERVVLCTKIIGFG